MLPSLHIFMASCHVSCGSCLRSLTSKVWGGHPKWKGMPMASPSLKYKIHKMYGMKLNEVERSLLASCTSVIWAAGAASLEKSGPGVVTALRDMPCEKPSVHSEAGWRRNVALTHLVHLVLRFFLLGLALIFMLLSVVKAGLKAWHGIVSFKLSMYRRTMWSRGFCLLAEALVPDVEFGLARHVDVATWCLTLVHFSSLAQVERLSPLVVSFRMMYDCMTHA